MNRALRARGRREPSEGEIRVERVRAAAGGWQVHDADAAAKLLDWDAIGDEPEHLSAAVRGLMKAHPGLRGVAWPRWR